LPRRSSKAERLLTKARFLARPPILCDVYGVIEDVVELLDRSWDALATEQGVDFAVDLFRFHDLLMRDTRTHAILETLRTEEQSSRSTLDNEYADIGAELSAIVDELERDAVDHFNPEPEHEGDYDTSLPQIRAWLAQAMQPISSESSEGLETAHTNELFNAIEVVKIVAEKAEKSDLRSRLTNARRRLEHARRERRIFYATAGGSALVTLERHLADLHPPVAPAAQLTELGRRGRTRNGMPLGRLRGILFGDEQGDPNHEPDLKSLLADMRSDAKRVYDDVRRRLGAERSLLAVFHRYRQRCQWYDTERLRSIANKGPGKPEDRLTETLASYLFDHGFNPLTRPMVGKIQPDLLAPGPRYSFYVEAKQYDKSARGYLLKGMWQVWDMLDELRDTAQDVSEAFYVIYRRGGPRYSFAPRVEHGNRVVHILMIDIAATDERGSNAPLTEIFDPEDLLPVPVQSRRKKR